MSQHAIQLSGHDWVGLSKLASFFGERQAPSATRDTVSADRDVIDRLYRTLEIVTLVKYHADALRAHARGATEYDAMQLAVELRRLGNRLQSIEDSLSSAGECALELENQLLAELDERYRAQSVRHYAT